TVPMILRRIGVPPAPGDGLARPQYHVHASTGGTVSVPTRFTFEYVDGSFPLVICSLVGVEDSLGVRAFDEVVIAHEVLFTGDGAMVAEEVHRVHVAVEQVPAAVEESLRHAMTYDPGRCHLEPRLLPEAGQADGVVPAGVMPVDVEDLDGISQLV